VSEKSEKPTHREIARRRDEALKRALNTPPKPHKSTSSIREKKEKDNGKNK
jgi:hypothetical protein